MNKNRILAFAALLPVITLSVSGCYTPPEAVDNLPKFRESASASVVVRFYRWDHLLLVQPEYRDAGFLRPLKREDIGPAFNSLHVRRDMAVVVLGFNYQPGEQREIVEAWKVMLREQGFRRIVCLRSNDDSKKLNGLSVIEDSTQPVEPAKRTAQL
jgi:hypothetical protein